MVPIDNGELRSPIYIKALLSAKFYEFQNVIHTFLFDSGLIGKNLETDLEILPLRDMPSLDDLRKMDLTALRQKARPPSGLPNEKASEFFGPQSLDLDGNHGIHILVWLPPVHGAFHCLNLIIQ